MWEAFREWGRPPGRGESGVSGVGGVTGSVTSGAAEEVFPAVEAAPEEAAEEEPDGRGAEEVAPLPEDSAEEEPLPQETSPSSRQRVRRKDTIRRIGRVLSLEECGFCYDLL